MSAPLLSVEGISKTYESAGQTLRVLEGVSLSVAEGEALAITGPSGSGKSTLLAVMAGLERPSAGRVLYLGREIHAWNEDERSAWRRDHVGFIFQGFRLVPSLTALENVALPLEIGGAPARDALGRAEALLAELGLSDRARHLPDQLSGGEQQRVAIARAYAHGPKLILADEPTGSLDRDNAARVLEALLEANARHRAALVVVTHDPALAKRLGREEPLRRL
ncbi:MAG: ABC transporter ATP-binding protein [Elusimicrobia bacterium]|nr:ABC transporter ATP-binding protein [Elusimicrobiota bacterium]